MNVFVNVIERNDIGYISGQQVVAINVNNGMGRSDVHYKGNTPSAMHLYSAQENGTLRNEKDFIETVSHEVVHVFGSGDAYAEESKGIPGADPDIYKNGIARVAFSSVKPATSGVVWAI